MKERCLVMSASKIDITIILKSRAVTLALEKVKEAEFDDSLCCGGAALFKLNFLPCKCVR
jgi:hypothetical protein